MLQNWNSALVWCTALNIILKKAEDSQSLNCEKKFNDCDYKLETNDNKQEAIAVILVIRRSRVSQVPQCNPPWEVLIPHFILLWADFISLLDWLDAVSMAGM